MQQIGRYQLGGELGRGGMGVVYEASDPVIGRKVAIKAIRLAELSDPAERQSVRERFYRESQTAGRLTHPNIVAIHDVIEAGEMLYLVIEFVPGISLEKYLAACPRPGEELALKILRQAGGALDYAHQQGVIHRDIKPANIMLRDDGLVKLTDFGLAKLAGAPGLTRTGLTVGSPYYMAPEQIQGQQVDARTDQFSLAVTAYEILAGQKPFTGDTLSALFYKILSQDPPPPHVLCPEFSPELSRALARALAKEPARRFGGCTEFVESVAAALKPAPRAPAPAPVAAFKPEPIAPPAPAPQRQVGAPPPPPPPATGPIICRDPAIVFKPPPRPPRPPGSRVLPVVIVLAVAAVAAIAGALVWLMIRQAEGPPAFEVQPVSLKFYETSGKEPAAAPKQYRTRFGRFGTRYIGWALALEHPAPSADQPIRLEAVWQDPASGERRFPLVEEAVSAGSTRSTYTGTWKNEMNWGGGTHRIDLYSGSHKLMSESFDVVEEDEAPSGRIRAIGATVTGLYFFEAGNETPASEQRQRQTDFKAAETRNIYWELNLNYPRRRVRTPFTIREIWRRGDGTLLHRDVDTESYVEAGWNSSNHTSGYGNPNPGSFWTAGSYTLDLFVGTEKVASGTFRVE